ncbi:uncharacterized protein LOC112493810 isoform X2 [Cephus cinctus]|uniref:Uncharacterized protein LOC112493810 isoform X2 n=1 Tax=Cephus cinctus TaxID=211228 RepID=A0AAJ7VXQ6_CEPCN|nr:uncharacterized protein LOC112493810 isoform X2 [Cephus cinctus]
MISYLCPAICVMTVAKMRQHLFQNPLFNSQIRKTCSATRLNLVLCSEYEQRSSQ